jgi:hypothetical protein
MKAARLIKLIEEAGYEARSYSGRSMFGRVCVGVDLLRGQSVFGFIADMIRAAVDHPADMVEVFADTLDETQQDAMGLGMIVYWPRVEWEEEDSDADIAPWKRKRNSAGERL